MGKKSKKGMETLDSSALIDAGGSGCDNVESIKEGKRRISEKKIGKKNKERKSGFTDIEEVGKTRAQHDGENDTSENGEGSKKKKQKILVSVGALEMVGDCGDESVERGKNGKKKRKRTKMVKEDEGKNSEGSPRKQPNTQKQKDTSFADAEKVSEATGRGIIKPKKDMKKNKEATATPKKVRFSGEVEVFSSEEKKLVQGKWYSLEEDQMIKDAVSRFIDEHALGEDGLAMVLNCASHPETRNCWREIALALPWRTRVSIYHRAHMLFERDEERKWSPEEYQLIRNFHENHGSDWRTLADAIGKHRIHVKDAWRRIKLPNAKTGNWSQDEYQTLFDLVNADLQMKAFGVKRSKHGMIRDDICWEAISQKLETRIQPACCSKWYGQLCSPMVAEGVWADVDDFRLVSVLYSLDASCVEDVDWDGLLEDRSGDVCLKRWKQMVKHIGDYANKSFSEQVEVLSKRYCPDLLETKEAFDSRPVDS